MLIDPRAGGLGLYDMTDGLFGPTAGPQKIALAPLQTEVFEVAIDASFFPALMTGNIGLWALFTDTDDGWFGIDYLSLVIETEAFILETFFQGMGNDGFKITPNPPADGADLIAPFRDLRPFGSTGTGFDEAITSLAIHVIPTPGVGMLLAIGGCAMIRRRRRTGGRGTAVALIAVAAIASTVNAVQTIELDEEEMVRRSSTIMYGMVEHVESFWNEDQTQIWTTVDVRVVEYWKGWRQDDLIQVSYLGGTVGDLTYFIVGQPQLTVNEEVVLYLERFGQSPLPFTGMKQGKLMVEIDPINGERVIRGTGQTLDERRTKALEVAARERAEFEPRRLELERTTGRPVIDFDALHIGDGAPEEEGEQ